MCIALHLAMITFIENEKGTFYCFPLSKACEKSNTDNDCSKVWLAEKLIPVFSPSKIWLTRQIPQKL